MTSTTDANARDFATAAAPEMEFAKAINPAPAITSF